MTAPNALTFASVDHEKLHAAIARQRETLQGEIQPRSSALLIDTEARIEELDMALSAVRDAMAKTKNDIDAMESLYADMQAYERDAAVELAGNLALSQALRTAGVTK